MTEEQPIAVRAGAKERGRAERVSEASRPAPYPWPVHETDLTALVGAWLPLPDAAERLGTDVGKVRRMLADGTLVAVRLGENRVLGVPERFLVQADGTWSVLASLAGTLTVLRDAGFGDDDAVAWLFTPDESLRVLGTGAPTLRPVDALLAGHKTEIRRRAQALAL